MATTKTSTKKNEAGRPVTVTRLPVVVHDRPPENGARIGNQAMLRRLSPARPQMQCKLVVGAVNDPLEAEADSAADYVMRMPKAMSASPADSEDATTGDALQRKCSTCQEEDEKLSRKLLGSEITIDGGEAPPLVHEVLRSSGEPLEAETRALFEPRFGADFGSVRVHTHELAGRSAQAVNAMAYTVGDQIVFGQGHYAPGTAAGQHLLAHELAHTIQQTRPDGLAASTDHAEAAVLSSGPLALSRAVIKVGPIPAKVNYGDLVNIPASGYVAAIQSRYLSYTGAALDPATLAQITAFTPDQQQWVLFALDVLSENTAQTPGLNTAQAFQRVVALAPTSTTHPLGTASFDFEREVLVSSGWAEEAVSGGLTPPSATSLTVIDPLLNPPPSASAPPGGVFDAAIFNTELPLLTRARLSGAPQNSANWPGTRTQPLGDVQAVGDVIQTQARSFFSPFTITARDNRWLAGWQYSAHISSVTTDAAGNPASVSRDERLNLIRNRATIMGLSTASGPSLFSRTNFDSNRTADATAFETIVTTLEADPTVQSLVDDLIRHTGRHIRTTHEVGISTEVSTASSECETRWLTVRTLCHELMHALAHPDFIAAVSSSPRFPSGINADQVLVEGFAEVLGGQLFRFLRSTAAGDAALLALLTQGVTGTCTPPTTAITLGYGDAAANAQAIRNEVLDERFRAAYFHGRVSLIGL